MENDGALVPTHSRAQSSGLDTSPRTPTVKVTARFREPVNARDVGVPVQYHLRSLRDAIFSVRVRHGKANDTGERPWELPT